MNSATRHAHKHALVGRPCASTVSAYDVATRRGNPHLLWDVAAHCASVFRDHAIDFHNQVHVAAAGPAGGHGLQNTKKLKLMNHAEAKQLQWSQIVGKDDKEIISTEGIH